jgi:hypothetical protein
MELDETDPAVWLKLEGAVEEYIQNNSQALKNVCERLLLPYQNDEKWSENLRIQHYPKSKGSTVGTGADISVIGFCRNLSFRELFSLNL